MPILNVMFVPGRAENIVNDLNQDLEEYHSEEAIGLEEAPSIKTPEETEKFRQTENVIQSYQTTLRRLIWARNSLYIGVAIAAITSLALVLATSSSVILGGYAISVLTSSVSGSALVFLYRKYSLKISNWKQARKALLFYIVERSMFYFERRRIEYNVWLQCRVNCEARRMDNPADGRTREDINTSSLPSGEFCGKKTKEITEFSTVKTRISELRSSMDVGGVGGDVQAKIEDIKDNFANILRLAGYTRHVVQPQFKKHPCSSKEIVNYEQTVNCIYYYILKAMRV